MAGSTLGGSLDSYNPGARLDGVPFPHDRDDDDPNNVMKSHARANGYQRTVSNFDIDAENFFQSSWRTGDALMEDNTVSHSTTRPVPICPSRTRSGFSTSTAGLDDTASLGQADSLWDVGTTVFERTNAFSRSPATSFSGSFQNYPSYFPQEKRYERSSQGSLDLHAMSPISPSLSSPVSPYTAPMSRNASFNGRRQDDSIYEWRSIEEEGGLSSNRFGMTDHCFINDPRASSIFSTAQIPHMPLDPTPFDPDMASYGSLDNRHLAPMDRPNGGAPLLVAHPPSPRRKRSPFPKRTAPESELSKLLCPVPKRVRGNSEPSKPPKNLSLRMKRPPSIKSTCSSEVDVKAQDDPIFQVLDDQQLVSHDDGGETKPIAIPRERGRRKNPLTEEAKMAAKQVRTMGTVCIRCKLNRHACHRVTLDGPCMNCLKANEKPGHKGEVFCVTAKFSDVVKDASCVFPPNLAIEHLRLDGRTRCRLPLPRHFLMDDYLRRLNALRSRYDIRVSLGGRSLCVMDLDKCYRFVTATCQTGTNRFDFRSFLDRGDFKDKDNWTDCIRDCNVASDQLNILPIWTNMPNKATYSYLLKGRPLNNGQRREEDIDVDNVQDYQNLIDVAILFHIFVRRLELVACATLEKQLFDAYKPLSTYAQRLFEQLGRILLTLRWRVSYYKVFGQPASSKNVQWTEMQPEDQESLLFEKRLEMVTESLYHFFFFLEKRPKKDVDRAAAVGGERRKYEDTMMEVVDEFPTEENGFERWMEKGKALITLSDAASREMQLGLGQVRAPFGH